jgi:hypothetical protein
MTLDLFWPGLGQIYRAKIQWISRDSGTDRKQLIFAWLSWIDLVSTRLRSCLCGALGRLIIASVELVTWAVFIKPSMVCLACMMLSSVTHYGIHPG